MKDIDFLPQRYRRDRAGRTAVIWRIGTLSLLMAVLGGMWLYDTARRRQLEQELAEATRQHEQMMALANQASTLRSQLTAINAQADLWTYLRHPWPKTQILSELAKGLPEKLSLEEVRIDRGPSIAMQQTGLLRDVPRSLQQTEPAAADTRTEAQRDLARLQATVDVAPIIVLLRGSTIDMAALHAYLDDMGQAALFAKAELVSLEREPAGTPSIYRFVARFTVRAGYGQPNGPTTTVAARPVELENPFSGG